MKTSIEIINKIRTFLNAQWDIRKCDIVPDSKSIALDNDAGDLEGAVLYADMAGFSELVKQYSKKYAAKMVKVFLYSVCETIRNNGGVITSFDGDRVMAVFVGNRKCSNSAKTALQIKFIVTKINEEIAKECPTDLFVIDYAVGVDVSNLLVVKTGIWGDNYLAWIGDAANTAAKLSEIRNRAARSFITKRMFERLNDEAKFCIRDNDKNCMWSRSEIKILGQTIYESNWNWQF